MPWRVRTAILVAACLVGTSLFGADRSITVALVPDGLTHAERVPLEAYLTKAMGRPVHLVVPERYEDTVSRLEDGTYDFACLGALVYVRAHAKDGVIPLVQRTADLQFHSVFITSANSTIHSLRDLRGRQFAFGDLNSASAHLVPYRELKLAGIDPDSDLRTRYSGSHPMTAALVESGAVDAGVLDETVYNSMISGGKLDGNKVRVFYTSKPFVDYVYVARKGVSDAEQEKFAHALLALKKGEDDPVLKILRANQFVVASDQEYESIRQIAKELKVF